MNVVIVESPAKAKTINKYLGSDYNVIASYGHIRDLPSKNGSVLPEKDFEMVYEINGKSVKYVKDIAKAVKSADNIFLATDPDREGESISWHIVEALKESKALKNQPIKRIVFTEITKKAVLEAIKNPRDIDIHLVNAQQARRALDYLVGFNLSPVLWRKLPGSRSAGRVQSVALRLICEREDEIENFISREYWDVKFNFLTKNNELFFANLTHFDGKKLDKFDLPNKESVDKILGALNSANYKVDKIEKKKINRNPYAPFTTSSLQQEASRKLNMSPSLTMSIAQKLYEGISIAGELIGLITYMRTDGVQLSDDAITSARNVIKSEFGDKYLPEKARIYKTKAKNAQEAHEAIRPTNPALKPKDVKDYLTKDQYELYELIWKRTIACQMESAVLDQMIVTIFSNDKKIQARASGSAIAFDGFLKLYREDVDDKDDSEDDERILPKMLEGEDLKVKEVKPAQHFTEAPPRYSEASLVKKLEELGIGRPSTYTSIISVLQDREYVKLEKKRFIPEERGRLVTAFLVSFFKKYVEYGFTAELENELDLVAGGEFEWKSLLRKFWDSFYEQVQETGKLSGMEVTKAIDSFLENHVFKSVSGEDPRQCPTCKDGKLHMAIGKFGAFVACSSYPECKYTRPIVADNKIGEGEGEEGNTEAVADQIIGSDPATGFDIYLKKGPYGLYFQLGEQEKGSKTKPKRVAIPAFLENEEINMNFANQLFSLPKEIGIHPSTGKMISLGIGKFGPYLLHDEKYTSLPKDKEIFSIGVNRAVDIIAESAKPKAKKSSVEPIKNLGKDSKNNEILIYDGRYGPYFKYNKKNIAIPKKLSVDSITLAQAEEIIKAYTDKNQ